MSEVSNKETFIVGIIAFAIIADILLWLPFKGEALVDLILIQ